MVFFMALILAGLTLLCLWYVDRLMKPDDSEQQHREHHAKHQE
jgi:hypothetical protein